MSRSSNPDKTIGERIKARRLLRTWSVRHAADRAGMSHASWSRIERGLQAADNRFVLANIASALECSITELTGTPMPSADRRAAAAQAGVSAVRRALVEIEPTNDGTPPSRPLPALADDLGLLRRLRHDCDYAGATALAPQLLSDLHAASSGPERPAALRLLCEATFLSSSLLRALGHPADSWLGAERCHALATETQDHVLLGLAAFARAGAAICCGSYVRGLALAEHAATALDPHAGHPNGLEMLGALQLMCAAAGGAVDGLDAGRAWMTEAARIADRTGETTTHALYFGPTNVKLWHLGIEVEVGDPGRAVAIATTTDVTAAQVNSRLVFFHADVARAYARLGRRDHDAVRHLLVAERVAPQHVHSSPLLQETTRALLDRAQRSAGGSALRGLCERMQVGN